jgi:hypothetical protein
MRRLNASLGFRTAIVETMTTLTDDLRPVRPS